MRIDTEGHDDDKIIVRSNGTVTYVGKDIAYQLWKLGLLDQDFNYEVIWIDGRERLGDRRRPGERRFIRRSVTGIRSTTSSTSASPICRTSFGRDCSGWDMKSRSGNRFIFSYEVVALTPVLRRTTRHRALGRRSEAASH